MTILLAYEVKLTELLDHNFCGDELAVLVRGLSSGCTHSSSSAHATITRLILNIIAARLFLRLLRSLGVLVLWSSGIPEGLT